MSFEDLVGDEELVGDDDLDALLALGDDDEDAMVFGDDPDVEALLAGDDDDSAAIIGAARSPKLAALSKVLGGRAGALVRQTLGRTMMAKAKARLRQKAVAKLASRRAIGVRARALNTAGEIPVGINTGEVAAGGNSIFIIQPPVLFKPKRLLIPGSISPSWTLDDVTLGLRNCLLTSNPVPCEVFSEQSINQGWKIPTLQIGQSLSMTFTNRGGSPATLRGAWLGVYADT